jgi:hypothetical protein
MAISFIFEQKQGITELVSQSGANTHFLGDIVAPGLCFLGDCWF